VRALDSPEGKNPAVLLRRHGDIEGARESGDKMRTDQYG